MAKLVITIQKDGTVKMLMKESPGKTCLETTKELEKQIGEIVDKQLTMDFYQAQSANVNPQTISENN